MKDVVKAFDLYAEDYDRWFDTEEGRVIFEMEVEAVRPLIRDFRYPFIEIGVGSGRFAKELGIDFGIDPSSKLLEIAKSRGINVKKARGEKLPFSDESFGGVFILFTLCFVEIPERVLLESSLREPTAGKPLRGDLSGLWTFRVGRFRIVYRHPPGRIVEIVALGPRRTIYAETFRLICRSPHRRGQGDPEDPS